MASSILHLEELIKEKSQNELDLLYFLRIHTPENITVENHNKMKDQWKKKALKLLVGKGIIQDRENLSLDDVWDMANKSLEKEKTIHNSYDDFSFYSRGMSQAVLDHDEAVIPHLKLHKCIVSSNGGRTVLISRSWHDMSEEEQMRNIDRKYVEITADTPSISIRISNPEWVSSPSEIASCLQYSDTDRQNIDWQLTIFNLKEYASSRYYDNQMIKSALLNFIKLSNRFRDAEYFMTKSCDDIAKALLKAAAKIDKRVIHRNNLNKLTREVGTPLTETLERASQYLKCLYPAQDADKTREHFMFQALISFTEDPLARHISEQVKSKKLLGEPTNIRYYTELALKIESQQNSEPTRPLQYNRKIDNLDILQMNTSITDDDPLRKYRSGQFLDSCVPFHDNVVEKDISIFVPNRNTNTYDIYFRSNSQHYMIPIDRVPTMSIPTFVNNERIPNCVIPGLQDLFYNGAQLIPREHFDGANMNPANRLSDTHKQEMLYNNASSLTANILPSAPAFQFEHEPIMQGIVPIPRSPNRYNQLIQSVKAKISPVTTRSMHRTKEQIEAIEMTQKQSPIPSSKEVSPTTSDMNRSSDNLTETSFNSLSPEKDKNIGHFQIDSSIIKTSRNPDNPNRSDTNQTTKTGRITQENADPLFRNNNNGNHFQNNDRNRSTSGNSRTYENNRRSASKDRNNSDNRANNSRDKDRNYPRNQSNDGNRSSNWNRTSNNRNKSNSPPRGNRSANNYNSSNPSDRNRSSGRNNDNYSSKNNSNTDRYPSRQQDYTMNQGSQNRYPSNDRNNRSSYNDSPRNYEQRNLSQNNTNNDGNSYRSRQRSASYDRYNDQTTQNRNRERQRSFSNNRRTEDRNNRRNDRSSSNNSRNRPRETDPRYRSNSRDNNNGSSNDRRSRSDQYNTDRSSYNRPASADIHRDYPHCRPGHNCSDTYNPLKSKYCSKCMSPSHHPFNCPSFKRYNPKVCSNCQTGNHFPNECNTKIQSIPFNNIRVDELDKQPRQAISKALIEELSSKIQEDVRAFLKNDN